MFSQRYSNATSAEAHLLSFSADSPSTSSANDPHLLAETEFVTSADTISAEFNIPTSILDVLSLKSGWSCNCKQCTSGCWCYERATSPPSLTRINFENKREKYTKDLQTEEDHFFELVNPISPGGGLKMHAKFLNA